MKNCAKCGASLEDNALFCNNCGTKMPAEPAVALSQPFAESLPALIPTDAGVLAVKKKSKKPLIIFAASVLLIAACILLWWLLIGQYRTFEALKEANANARLAYDTAEETARNAFIYNNYEVLDSLEYSGPVSDIPEDNAIGKAIKSALEKENVGGYICIRFHAYDNNTDDSLYNFVHWSAKKSGAMIGQCPWAPNSEDKSLELEFGTYSPGY